MYQGQTVFQSNTRCGDEGTPVLRVVYSFTILNVRGVVRLKRPQQNSHFLHRAYTGRENLTLDLSASFINRARGREICTNLDLLFIYFHFYIYIYKIMDDMAFGELKVK